MHSHQFCKNVRVITGSGSGWSGSGYYSGIDHDYNAIIVNPDKEEFAVPAKPDKDVVPDKVVKPDKVIIPDKVIRPNEDFHPNRIDISGKVNLNSNQNPLFSKQ